MWQPSAKDGVSDRARQLATPGRCRAGESTWLDQPRAPLNLPRSGLLELPKIARPMLENRHNFELLHRHPRFRARCNKCQHAQRWGVDPERCFSVLLVLRHARRSRAACPAPTVCGQERVQIDLLGSLAALLGKPLPADAAPDSMNVLPALVGESRTGRDSLVEQGNGLAVRQGSWKYLPPAQAKAAASKGELYNLSEDPGETKNLAAQHSDRCQELQGLLSRLQEQGRSRP